MSIEEVLVFGRIAERLLVIDIAGLSLSDRMREHHHGYLDEHSKTVSARQAETFEVLSNQFVLCCRLKPAVRPSRRSC